MRLILSILLMAICCKANAATFSPGSEFSRQLNTNRTAAAYKSALGLGSAGNANVEAFQPASDNLTNWSLLPTNVVGAIDLSWSNSYQPANLTLTNLSGLATNELVRYTTASFLTNWANAVSNLAQSKQLGSDNLTNWSGILTSDMARATATIFLTNWVNAVSNLTQTKQFGDATLTNLSGLATGQLVRYTTSDYLTNWANSISNLTQTKQNGSAVLTNIVATGAITNFDGTIFSNGATLLTIKDGAVVTNINIRGQTNQGDILFGTDNTTDIGKSGAQRPRNIYNAGGFTNGLGINTGGGITVANSSVVAWTGRSQLVSDADGKLRIANNSVGATIIGLLFAKADSTAPALGMTNGNLRVLGGDTLYGSQATNGFISDGGFYYPSNGNMNTTIITAGMKNGDCWVGMLSNRLQAVFWTNSAAVFKVLGP